MSDGHYDAAAYCAMCDRPISIGPLCDRCGGHDAEEINEADMHWQERASLAGMAITNGNLTDAISVMMRDGDVNVDSVRAALGLVAWLYDNHTRDTHKIIGLLIRTIDVWETQ